MSIWKSIFWIFRHMGWISKIMKNFMFFELFGYVGHDWSLLLTMLAPRLHFWHHLGAMLRHVGAKMATDSAKMATKSAKMSQNR